MLVIFQIPKRGLFYSLISSRGSAWHCLYFFISYDVSSMIVTF